MKEDHGSVGCSADVIKHLDYLCSGRKHCQLNLPDPALHSVLDCPKEIMPYLEASYVCVHGIVTMIINYVIIINVIILYAIMRL